MSDYTLIVYLNSELTKWDEYLHVDAHGMKEGCLWIHYVKDKGPKHPEIIPVHAFYRASVLEK
jgi:hypothetical protein